MVSHVGRWTGVGAELRKRMRSEAVRKIAKNSGWLMGERVLTMALALTLHVWLARYLGPTRFGVLSYAISLVGLFGTFTYLGLSGLVLRDLVEQPEARDEILGTVFGLKLIGGLIGVVLIGAVAFAQPMDGTTRPVLVLAAAGLLFHAFRVVEFWFASRVESRYAVLASSAAAITAAVANASLILAGAGVVGFAVVLFLQPAALAAGLLFVYIKRGGVLSSWRYVGGRARSLLSQSWPLLLASAGALVYLKVDQVMLGVMIGHEHVGVYAVAARLSEVWYFIPAALALSVFPKIIESRKEGDAVYERRLQRTYNALAVMAVAVAILVTIASGPVIELLYDDRYREASRILAIHIWAAPAMFMGALLSKWLIAEDLLTFSFTRHLIGAVANVGLNLLLIPKYGGTGAAVATLVAYTLASYGACFTDPRTRVAGRMMTRAMLTPLLILRRS